MKCKICNEPFFSYGGRLCPKCQEQLDKDFVTVRDYIYDHPNEATVKLISEATGVNENAIIYLLEEERITATGDLAISPALHCQVCGRGINSGTICSSCRSALTKDLGSAASALENKEPAAPTFNTSRKRESDTDSFLISRYKK